MLAEIGATWRDAWKRLEHNPLLLLLLIVAIGGVCEGMARIIYLIQDYLFASSATHGYLVSAFAFQGVTIAASLIIYLLFTAAALFVVLHEESFFSQGRTLAPGQFWWRAVVAWSIVLIVPSLVSIPLVVLASFLSRATQSSYWWIGWSLCYVLLQAFLASLLLWRLPVYGVLNQAELPIDRGRPRGLFVAYAILFVAEALIGFAIAGLGYLDLSPLATLRVAAVRDAVMSLLSVLLAFVAVQRAGANDDPAITSVFE